MPDLVELRVYARRFLFCFGASCLFVCRPVMAHVDGSPPAEQEEGPQNQITLKGCLGKDAGQFRLATATPEGLYLLRGKTSGLGEYANREVVLEGSRGEDIAVDGFFKPFPSFRVERIVEVVEKQTPKLSASFTDRKTWREEKNEEYGVKYAHARDMISAPPNPERIKWSFTTPEGAEVVGRLEIPRTTYANANFGGGFFVISVNRKLTNEASCLQFEDTEWADSSYKVGELRYARAVTGGAAMGYWQRDYFFHIFRNKQCYELAFLFDEFSAHTADTGCNIPLLSEKDEKRLIDPLLNSVHYFRPAIRPLN